MGIKLLQKAFFGGEVSPEMLGHVDDPKYQNGLARCENFLVMPHGPVAFRPGMEFVREVKDSTKKTRLIRFAYSSTQVYAIELGAGYFRFHAQAGTILSVGVPVEVANSYAEADLFDIHYAQSGDVLTLVHPGYPPSELKRTGAATWVFAPIVFGATQSAPASVTATATTASSPSGLHNYNYVVTAVGTDGESVQSAVATCSNNLLQTGAFNTVNIPFVSFFWGGGRCRIYRESNGLYGYIGETPGLYFVDDNILPDLSRSPPIAYAPFTGAGNYPATVAYFEQRRVFGGGTNYPQQIFMTKSGSESNLAYSIPVRDDDSINIKLAALQRDTIRHLVPLSSLLALTTGGEWHITSGANSDAITPTSLSAKPRGYTGASNVQPVTANSSVIYPAAQGGRIFELSYSLQGGGFLSDDSCLRAPHLFTGYQVKDMAYSKAPFPVVWAISSSGMLLGYTFVPRQEIAAWHRHTTAGTFESVTVITEGEQDYVYCIVRRTINGASKRYIERMASRDFTSLTASSCGADAFLRYTGAPATTISGLGHLEGMTVATLADGAVQPPQAVTGGQIVLEQEASNVMVGLPYQGTLTDLPLAAQLDDAMGQGTLKNVRTLYARVYRSGGFWAGPGTDADLLTEFPVRRNEEMGLGAEEHTERVDMLLWPDWNTDGAITIVQRDPLPLVVVSIVTEIEVGG